MSPLQDDGQWFDPTNSHQIGNIMSEEYTYGNVSTEEFLDRLESLILQNPEMDGVELDDNRGRTWFIQLTSEHNVRMN